MDKYLWQFLVGLGLMACGHLVSAIWMAATMRSELRQRKGEAAKMEQRHAAMMAEAKQDRLEAMREHTQAITEMRVAIEKIARVYGQRLIAIETKCAIYHNNRPTSTGEDSEI